MAHDPQERHQTYVLELTRAELIHLRDVLSVLLPPAMEITMSQQLAALNGRHLIEQSLWKKLSTQCIAAQVPVGDEAPDFVVAIEGVPTVNVFKVDHDEQPPGDSVFNDIEGVVGSVTIPGYPQDPLSGVVFSGVDSMEDSPVTVEGPTKWDDAPSEAPKKRAPAKKGRGKK